MSARFLPASAAFALVVALCATPGDAQVAPAYPERDILSPFRTPADVYAPPDELFLHLRTMQAIADKATANKDFDAEGREIVDDEAWRRARVAVEHISVNAAYLAQIMRLHKNANDRATAFYGAFFCPERDHVFNLISHIPGEPERRIREAAMPRAVAYLRSNLGRTFGSLPQEHKDALIKAMPKIGSPAAKAAGISRAPVDADHLHDLRLVPFFQLLDLDEPIDQAQGLWFLKEVFLIRLDMALVWLEPSLPRIRQLLGSDDDTVREQAIGLIRAIGPKNLREAPTEDPDALRAWADEAAKALFPPIRNFNDTILQLHPSPERDVVVAAGTKALETSAIGDPASGKTKDGQLYRGFRIATVPADLKVLAIPEGSVITAVNGIGIADANSLLQVVRQQIALHKQPRLVVEYLRDEKTHVVEYRIR